MKMSDYDYYLEADFGRYAGEWVAILGNKVISHASTFKEVAENVDMEFAGKKPLIARIPEKMAQLL